MTLGVRRARQIVSIHAFRGEGDGGNRTYWRECWSIVSIHAFRGEGDRTFRNTAPPSSRFQSTPSGGKATFLLNIIILLSRSFNPRLPGGRRRRCGSRTSYRFDVSIHAFRGEGDRPASSLSSDQNCFNPRLPGGRRPFVPWPESAMVVFQSTPSGGKATGTRRAGRLPDRRFNPRLPGGRRRTSSQ